MLTKNGRGDHKRRLSRVHYIVQCAMYNAPWQCNANHVKKCHHIVLPNLLMKGFGMENTAIKIQEIPNSIQSSKCHSCHLCLARNLVSRQCFNRKWSIYFCQIRIYEGELGISRTLPHEDTEEKRNTHHYYSGAVVTWSIFSPVLTIYAKYIAHEDEVWDVFFKIKV